MTGTYQGLVTGLAEHAARTTLTKTGNNNPTTAELAAATRCALRHLLAVLQIDQPELFTALHAELAANHTNPRREPTMAIPAAVSTYLAADTNDRRYALAKAAREMVEAQNEYAKLLFVQATTTIRALCPGASAVILEMVDDADGGYTRIESVTVGARHLHPNFFKPTDDDTAAFSYQNRMNEAEADFGSAWTNTTGPTPFAKRWHPKRDPDAPDYDAFDEEDEATYYEIHLVDIDGIAPTAIPPANDFTRFNEAAYFDAVDDDTIDPAVRIAGMLVRVSLTPTGALHIDVNSKAADDQLPTRELGVPIVLFEINGSAVFTNETV